MSTRISWLVCSCVLLFSARSHAQETAETPANKRRGVVLSSGWKSDQAQAPIAQALSTEFGPSSALPCDWVEATEVRRRAKSLKAKLTDVAGRAAVAAELNLSIIVEVRVRGGENGARTRISLYDGSGEYFGHKEGPSPVADDAATALSGLGVELLSEYFEQEPPPPVEVASTAVPPPPPPPPPPAAQRTAVVSAEPSAEPAKVEMPTRPPWVEVRVGYELALRKAKIALADGSARLYDSGLYSAIATEAVIRPFAGYRINALRRLYLKSEYAHSIELKSNVEAVDPSTDTSLQGLSTQSWRLIGELGYAYALWRQRLEIGASVGVRTDVFRLADNPAFPSMRYLQVPFEVSLRLRLLSEYLYASAFGGYRLVVTDGGISPRFGDRAEAFGYAVGGALGGALPVGFNYEVRFTYQAYSLDFSGSATDAAATSGYDRRLLTLLLVGWQY